MIPGEPEWETKDARLAEGIPIPEETWDKIVKLADELGLKTEDY
jgi:LDH2 family malate/lactate/ureidoglycolate dehydrogenase